jgi:hypothetical protein
MKGQGLRAILLVVALAAVGTGSARAKDASEMDRMRDAVRADKRAYVSSMLALSEAEAARFWPIYDGYQRQLEAANRRRSVALVEVAGLGKPIGDLHAKSVAKELIAADDAEHRARRKLRDQVTSALPAKKAIRYLQLEWKMRVAQDYDLATTIPLLGE